MDISLLDPDLYSHGDPHALWRRLRREAPVRWHDAPGGPGFWAVTAHAPAQRVLQNWQDFTTTNGTVLRPDPGRPFPGAGKMLILTDPPRHTVLRRAASRLFTPRALAAFEEEARQLVRPLIAAAVRAGHCEFVGQVAARIPLVLAAGILGVSPADIATIAAATSQAAAHADDLEGVEAQVAHVELLMYYGDLMSRRREAPGDDLMSVLIAAQRSGAGITDEEIILTCDNVIVAASETTTFAAAGGVLALAEHPGQWAALRAGSVDPRRATDEILRWWPSTTHVMRTATRDTDLHGALVRAGDPVTVWIPAANRDEAVFPDAGELRLDRSPNPHLTFGGGVHFCLGAALARLVLRVLLAELAASVARLSVADEPKRLGSYALSGLTELPLELRGA